MDEYPQIDLSGCAALVTGAARGLGRAISLALAHAGTDVALGLRDVVTGAELAGQIETMGRRVLTDLPPPWRGKIRQTKRSKSPASTRSSLPVRHLRTLSRASGDGSSR